MDLEGSFLVAKISCRAEEYKMEQMIGKRYSSSDDYEEGDVVID